MKHKNTFLITGGAGHLGSHIGLILAQQGHTVVVLDSFEHNQDFCPQWAHVYRGDYGDPLILKKIFKEHPITMVIHCASSVRSQLSLQRPLECYYNNVAKTMTLLEIMHEHKIMALIFCSSSDVYGVPQEIPVHEDHSCIPVTPYGSSKLMIETIIKDCARATDMQFVILRQFNVSGAVIGSGLKEWHVPETHLIPLVLNACKSGAPLYVFGNDYSTLDGTAVRDYVHVQDSALAVVKAVEHLMHKKPSDVFNVGSGRGWSVKQVIDVAQIITQKECAVMYGPRREADVPVMIADTSKSTNLLGWKALNSSLELCAESAWKVERE